MAMPTGQPNTNLFLRQKHFSSISNEFLPDKSRKMQNKKPIHDPGNNNESGK